MSFSKEQRLQAWALFARMWVSQLQRPEEVEAHLPMLDEGDLPHALFYDVDANPVLIAQQVESLIGES